jgi:hypothetical protein
MQQRIGNNKDKIIYTTILILIIFYLLYVLFIFPILNRYVMTLLEFKPIILFLPKYSCSILLIIGILFLNKKSNLSCVLLNIASVGILLMWYSEFLYPFYSFVIIHSFFIEIIAIFILILTNKKTFINKYNIRRDRSKLIFVIITAILLAIWNQLMLFLNY